MKPGTVLPARFGGIGENRQAGRGEGGCPHTLLSGLRRLPVEAGFPAGSLGQPHGLWDLPFHGNY
jgi:hypothetical protein